jgi:hypothetical protein
MANLSDHSENLLLNFLMGGAAAAAPTARYVALFTAAPDDTGGGTEVTGGGYANSNEITFTATGAAFGTVTHVGILDATTAGNLLWHGALATSKAVGDGDSLVFAVGDLDFTLA